MSRVVEHTEQYFEVPDDFDSSPRDDDQRSSRLFKVWHVWRHHWQQALAQTGNITGASVLKELRHGRGFRSHRDDGGFALLKSDPVADIILVDGVLATDARAVELFCQRFRPLVKQVANNQRIRDLDRCEDVLTDLIVERRLATFNGLSGLDQFVVVAVSRSLGRQRRSEQSIRRELTHLTPTRQRACLEHVVSASRLVEIEHAVETALNSRSSPVDLADKVSAYRRFLSADELLRWQNACEEARNSILASASLSRRENAPPEPDSECHLLWQRILLNAFQTLAPGELIGLYLHVVKRQDGKLIAALLRMHPGTVSRTLERARQKLGEFIQRLATNDSDDVAIARECLSELLQAGTHASEAVASSLRDAARSPQLAQFFDEAMLQLGEEARQVFLDPESPNPQRGAS